jgi:hypothetical protein
VPERERLHPGELPAQRLARQELVSPEQRLVPALAARPRVELGAARGPRSVLLLVTVVTERVPRAVQVERAPEVEVEVEVAERVPQAVGVERTLLVVGVEPTLLVGAAERVAQVVGVEPTLLVGAAERVAQVGVVGWRASVRAARRSPSSSITSLHGRRRHCRTSVRHESAGRLALGRSSRHPWSQSGTLPCLRFGRSSRLVSNMRSPATSFLRVSAGSITSSM